MTKRITIFLTSLFLSLPLWWGVNAFQVNLERFFYAQISASLENSTFIKIPEKIQKPKLETEAKSAISLLIKKNGREIINFEKDSEKILPLASLTKLMTALIVLENKNYDLQNTWISVSQTAAKQENVPVFGNLDLERGKKFSVEKLLELMLIYSSNDAAYALSEVIGTENFVQKMNEKASELSLNNTHFVNPTGLDPENLHYSEENQAFFNHSTSKDLMKFSYYILKEYPLIFEIGQREGPYPLKNGVSKIVLPENQKVLGGKTGYTDEAGGCIVFIFKNEKEQTFFNVIMGAKSQDARIEEMQKLVNWLNI